MAPMFEKEEAIVFSSKFHKNETTEKLLITGRFEKAKANLNLNENEFLKLGP